MSERFKHLFSPIRMGSTSVKNRIACAPHGSGLLEANTQLPGERAIAYYVTKAKGGIGLLITEATSTHRTSWAGNPFRFPQAVTEFKKLADAVHDYDTKVICQLMHPGAQDTFVRAVGRVTWAPSPIPAPRNWATPHEMSVDEVTEIVESFARAAKVIRDAGFDGIELHGGHGYLINEFMSPFSNRRTDEYGGSLENRMRFPLQLIEAVRQAVGMDYTFGMRVSGDEFIEGGYTLDDMLIMAPMLAQPGKLDYLSVSAGNYRAPDMASDPTYSPLNSVVYLASAVKNAVSIPVITRGRIMDPIQAEEILANHDADMVAMCRGLIADPEWPNKARDGRLDEIRPCIACNEACHARIFDKAPISCSMNPVVGRELRTGWLELEPAVKKKDVLVIGGGPSGLETARVAALRGHSVTLYEKASELGGQTLIAGKAPGRESFLDVARYYTHQMKLLGVEVKLETELTADMIIERNPEAVVIAAGSIPIVPDMPGVEQDNVVEVRDVLAGKVKVGQNVVIIAGEHHIQALSAADFLATQGKKVEVLCEEYHAGSQIEFGTKTAIYERLFRAGVVLTPHTRAKQISGNSLVSVNVFTGQEHRIEEVDTVILACGSKEDNALCQSLKGRVKEVHLVGDCAGVRRLPDATMDGARVGRLL